MLVAVGPVPTSASTAPLASAAKKCKKKAAKKKKCKRKKPGAVVPGAQPAAPGGSSPASLAVTGVSATPNPVLGGSPSQGHVMISGAAPAAGQSVTLQSADSSRASVPASVNIAPGATSADFAITTTAGADTSVDLTATIGSSSQHVVLQVQEVPRLTTFSRLSNCITAGSTVFPAGTVGLDFPAAGNTFVSVVSDNPSALLVDGNGATIPNGMTTANVHVTAPGPTASSVTLTASLGPDMLTQTFRVRGVAEASVLTGVSLNPPTVAAGGSSTGTVTLDCEALADTPVALSTSAPTMATVPASVTVLAGQRTATFTVTTAPGGPGSATITATLGPASPSATLTIN
jgi:hypothetical protein